MQLGSSLIEKDIKNKVPYQYAATKEMKSLYIQYRAQYPGKYNYALTHIPKPLTEEEEMKRKEKEKKKRERQKQRKREKKEEEKHAMEKEIDWVERYVECPNKIPEKYARISALVAKRSGLRVKKLQNMKEVMRENWGQKIFRLINESYSPLFGYSPLSEKQINQLVKTYMPLVDLRLQSLIINEANELVGVGISMPSIVRALQKSRGQLLPFGWWHLLKALKWKHEDGVELLLIAIRPDYQSKGVNALIFNDLIPVYREMGFKWAETNPQLEDNFQSQAQWEYLNPIVHKRRRCYKRDIR